VTGVLALRICRTHEAKRENTLRKRSTTKPYADFRTGTRFCAPKGLYVLSLGSQP
jgi:hypothetical protein